VPTPMSNGMDLNIESDINTDLDVPRMVLSHPD
jgi:hypothetical protein